MFIMHIPWFFSFLQICRSSLYIWDISPLCVISPSIFSLKLWYLVPIFFLLLLLYFLITSSLIMDYLNVCLVFKCWQIFSSSLLLVSSLIPLYLENMLCTISILLNLSKFVLRPMIGSLLVSSCRHWEARTRCSCLWNVV